MAPVCCAARCTRYAKSAANQIFALALRKQQTKTDSNRGFVLAVVASRCGAPQL